ncbi:hypothetical protein Tco_1448175 [Tanacetum coccineum]
MGEETCTPGCTTGSLDRVQGYMLEVSPQRLSVVQLATLGSMFQLLGEVVCTWYGLRVNEDIGFVDLCCDFWFLLPRVIVKYSESVRRYVDF